MGLFDWIRPLYNFASQHGRRAHVANGRAHIELRPMNPRQAAELSRHLPEHLLLLEGVHWVDVNAAVGRAIVAFDADLCDLRYIIKVVEHVETALGLHVLPFPIDRPEHPGDLEPLVRCVIELGGDVVGIGLAIAGRALRAPTLPIQIDALALVSLFDAPRLRRAVEDRVGRQTTSLVLTLSNAITQGLAQSPLGPVADIAHHGLVLVERVVRLRTWMDRESELCSTPGAAAREAAETGARVVDLPAGPVERYADAALLGSGVAFTLGVMATGNIADATAPLLSGLPKPARLGREAFASYLALALALRGILPLDRQALRRLDRVDCLVVPLGLLVRLDVLPGSFVAVDGCDPAVLRRRLASLVDPCRPWDVQGDGPWSVGPLDASRTQDLAAGYRLMALRHGDVAVAVARARAVLDPDAESLIHAARKAEMRIVVAADAPLHIGGIDVDEVIPAGNGLVDEVRRLQREGRVVCVVDTADAAALAVADCGIGLVRAAQEAPWTADLLCGDRLDDARFLIEACRSARIASHQSVQLAAIGAGLGLVMSLGGLSRETSGRVATAVNVTSLVAMANGVRLSAGLALRPAPARRDTTPWHALDVATVLERLGTSIDGLGVAEAARRYVGEASPPGTLARLGEAMLDQLRNPLTPILAVGAGLSAVAGSVIDAALVTSVVVLNAAIGGVQQLRTDAAIDGLSEHVPAHVMVRRDGREETIHTAAIVPGDVLLLRAGDAVPADCRIVAQDNLEVDESSLTGESLPVAKTIRASRAADVAERSSMLYEGTSIAAGTATAVVIAVGNATEARRAAGAARARTPTEGVEARLESLTSFMAPTAVLSGIGVAAAGLLRGRPGREVIGAGTSLAVAAVPEGLPLLATAAQLAAARRLSLRGTLVRNPRTIEALGRVDVVCFDKTGTVTEGRLRLQTVWDGAGNGESAEPVRRAILAAALRATPEAVGGRSLPHPTDQALADATTARVLAPDDDLPGWIRLAELAFEPGRAYHATLGRLDDTLRLSVKGAPEVVIARCRAWQRPDGSVVAMDAGLQARLAEEAGQLAGGGLRILAVAERDAPLDAAFDGDAVTDLLFRGFLGFSDPVRVTAGDALRGLRAAGVTPMLMTGDHPGTAARIARELEIADDAGVVTGAEIEDLDDDALDTVLTTTRVFARVTPAHKARLVAALQRTGHTVAMTGDGANDAAAIRMANVGIALGRRGTAAARDAADLVVTDDRIETIVDAVLEGRAMWVSVRDAVAVLVGGNLGELAFTVATSMLGEAPLNARQLLLVNLLTDVAPAMAIALRPPPPTTAEALLHEGPEASLGGHLTADIACRAAFTAAGAGVAWMLTRARGARREAGTVALTALVATQLGQTLASGGRSPLVVATGLGSFAALSAVVQTPGLSQLCGCTPLGITGWTTALAASGAATAASVAVPWIWPGAEAWFEGRAHELSRAWPTIASLRAWSPWRVDGIVRTFIEPTGVARD